MRPCETRRERLYVDAPRSSFLLHFRGGTALDLRRLTHVSAYSIAGSGQIGVKADGHLEDYKVVPSGHLRAVNDIIQPGHEILHFTMKRKIHS